jgi:hypothetical protein
MKFDGMAETCTIAAKTMLFYRHKFLEENSIAVIPQGGFRGHRNQSWEGMVWLLQQETDNYPGLQHARSTQGEKVICGSPVDGFHAPSKTVLQFHGCYFHGCCVCYTHRSLTNAINGETFEALRLKTALRTKKMRNAGYTVVEKWSCEFTEDDKRRVKELGLTDKVSQLIPKEAFYGGRTEAVNLHASVSNNKEIRYYDVTSEYPFVNARKAYPVGHPIVFLKHQLPQSNDQWGTFNLFGAVKCSIIPPRQLLHPVLPYRHGGTLLFPLCHTCCAVKLEGFCPHNASERALHGTWLSIEIDKAIELGYQLDSVTEAWHFERRSTNLFHPFINTLYKTKLEASGFPNNVQTPQEKEDYMAEIEQNEGFKLELEKIGVNPGRRQMSKILLNSFWGKFAQRENLTQVEFINTDLERFNELLFSDNIYKVMRVTLITEDIVYVVYKNIFCKPNPKGNIFVAAFTTAHARLHLYKAVEQLGNRVLYMDTDSVVFKHRPGQWAPNLSNYLGDWTDEIPSGWRIVTFITCGPKNYSYIIENISTGQLNTVMKIKGLRLSKLSADMLSPDVMLNQVSIFASNLKRPADFDCKPEAKRPCLDKAQKCSMVNHNRHLNMEFVSNGADACLKMESQPPSAVCGPCNCQPCVSKTSVTVAQVCFRKHQCEGYVETLDVRKEYKLVLNKRWLIREHEGCELPLDYLTLPFGYKHYAV